MKKNVVKKVIIIGVVVAMVLAGCSQSDAQSAAKEKKIIGTWVTIPTSRRNSPGSVTVVFNSDGTVNWDGETTEWFATDTKIAMAVESQSYTNAPSRFIVGEQDMHFFDYSLSGDGKTMFLGNWLLTRN